jgi:hypothetical protein
LRAFHRPARSNDALPQRLRSGYPNVVASRRIAAVRRSFRGAATLYLAVLPGKGTCLITVDRHGAGGGCSPSWYFMSRARRMSLSTGNGFLSGVAADEVARLVMMDKRGGRHPIRLTRDGGFIYVCRAYNGCVDVVAAVEAYDHRGLVVSREQWHRVRARTP